MISDSSGNPLRLVHSERQPLSSFEDDDLMRLVRKGHEGAFAALVRRHQGTAMQVAIRHMGNVQSAEDVVQDSFLELLRCAPKYQSLGKFKIFLFRIVVSRARMAHRSWYRARLLLTTPPDQPQAPVAEALLLEEEHRQEVHRAISKLPERYRAVVTLRFGAGLSYREVAETLQVPVGTVKSRMPVALARLKAKLKGRSDA